MQRQARREGLAGSGGTNSAPARDSLLSRLKDWGDNESWKVFFDTYWRLIYHTALRAGLSDAEAQDVVQETVISVLKSIGKFELDGNKGTFKSWLMRLTQRRIVDQHRKRQPGSVHTIHWDDARDALEQIPDPTGGQLNSIWEAEWEQNLWEAALDRVKRKIDSRHYEVFELYVFKGWKAAQISETLKINPGQVYLIKHRLHKLLRKELQELSTQPI